MKLSRRSMLAGAVVLPFAAPHVAKALAVKFIFRSNFAVPWLASAANPLLPFRPNAFWQNISKGYKDFSGATYDVNPNNPAFASFAPFTVDANGVLSIHCIPTTLALAAAIAVESPGVAIPPYSAGIVQTNPDAIKFTFGYFEWKMKLPVFSVGLWPALWLFATRGADSAHSRQEIDCLELFSNVPIQHMTLHGTPGATGSVACDPANFHLYGVDWQSNVITFYLDHKKVFEVLNTSWYADPMCALMQFTMNPPWLGKAGQGDGKTAMQMDIEYFAVWDRPPFGPIK